MSLAIPTNKITHVFIRGGSHWSEITPGSFFMDAFEFNVSGYLTQPGETCGFTFTDRGGRRIYAPMSALIAVMTDEEEGE